MSKADVHPDRFPVIIPSYKGREYVDSVITALPEQYFRPIVAVNGEDDGTVDRALELGAEAFTSPEQGKMPAIQEALRRLGQDAVHPLVIMDVDTRIIRPEKWYSEAQKALEISGDRPLYMTGPIVFTHRNALEAALRTARYNQKSLSGREYHHPQDGAAPINSHYGPNTLLHLKTHGALRDTLDLPNYWPGEDRAVADVILNNGGVFRQNHSTDMLASTPLSEAYPPIGKAAVRKVRNMLGLGKEQNRQHTLSNYVQRGPNGSVPYARPEERSRR